MGYRARMPPVSFSEDGREIKDPRIPNNFWVSSFKMETSDYLLLIDLMHGKTARNEVPLNDAALSMHERQVNRRTIGSMVFAVSPAMCGHVVISTINELVDSTTPTSLKNA